jgi:cytochrome c oxidase cbb3-type subunit I/II
MWTSGITQGLMWRAFTSEGTLKYPDFSETVTQLFPFYWMRLIGGILYMIGLVIMMYNLYRSIAAAQQAGVDMSDPEFQAMSLPKEQPAQASGFAAWHRRLEGKPVTFGVLTLLAVIIGGPAQYIPLMVSKSNIPTIPSVRPYTALELEGRDIYVSEGCYNCHSQMVRPLKEEVVRYGEFSKSGEFVYDRPFQFGSKRTGPDLHRVGGKYPHFWHYRHMLDPRSTSPGSIMPPYPWLYEQDLDTSLTSRKLRAFKTLGAPYTREEVESAEKDLRLQATEITDALVSQGVTYQAGVENKKIIALIGYLQRLGTDIRGEQGGIDRVVPRPVVAEES